MILRSEPIDSGAHTACRWVFLALCCGALACGGSGGGVGNGESADGGGVGNGGSADATLTITEPAGTTYTNGTLIVQLALQGDAAPDEVDLLVDRVPVTSLKAPYRYSLDTTLLAEGSHVLIAQAIFPDGVVTSLARMVVVDRTPPRVVSYEPAPNAQNVVASAPVHLKFSEPVSPASLQDGIQFHTPGSLGFTTELSADQTELLISLHGLQPPTLVQASVVATDFAGNRSEPLEWSWSVPTWVTATSRFVVAPPSSVRAGALAVDGRGLFWVVTVETVDGFVVRGFDNDPDAGSRFNLPLPDAGTEVRLAIDQDLVLLPDTMFDPWDYGGPYQIVGGRLVGHDLAGALVLDAYYVAAGDFDQPFLLASNGASLRLFRDRDPLGPSYLASVGVVTGGIAKVRDVFGGLVLGNPGELDGGPGVVESPDSAGLSIDAAGHYQIWSFEWDGVASSPSLWKWSGAEWIRSSARELTPPRLLAFPPRCTSRDVRAWYDVAAGEPRVLCLTEGNALVLFRGTGKTLDVSPPVPASSSAHRPVSLAHDSLGRPVVLLTGTVSRLLRLGEQGWEQLGTDLEVTFTGDEFERGGNQRLACATDRPTCHVLVIEDATDGGQTVAVLTPNP